MHRREEHHHHGSGRRHVHAASERSIGLAAALTGAFMLAEVAGGLYAGSLALLADAGHMASDAAALGLGLFALWIADRPSAARRTFGHLRAEILAALANGVALLAVAVVIVIEAIERLASPPPVRAGILLAVAGGGLVVNLLGLLALHGGSRRNLSVRGAFLHVVGDALGSVGALAAGAVIWAFGWRWADPAASLAIAALVVVAAWQLVREAVDVLMEAAPAHLDVEEIRAALLELREVSSVHDLHVWTITSGSVALSCHAVAAPGHDATATLAAVQRRLRDRFGIDHATIQVEPETFVPNEGSGADACADAACDTSAAAAGAPAGSR